MNKNLSEQLLNQTFEEVRVGILGNKPAYLKSEVDAFMQQTSIDVEHYEKSIKNLERKIELLEQQAQFGSETRSLSEEEVSQFEKDLTERAKNVEKMERSFKRMVIIAEEQADQVRQKARDEAANILMESKKRAEELLIIARKKHDEAIAEADNIVGEAKERREKVQQHYLEIRQELANIYKYIEKAVLKESGEETTFESEKSKQAIVNQ